MHLNSGPKSPEPVEVDFFDGLLGPAEKLNPEPYPVTKPSPVIEPNPQHVEVKPAIQPSFQPVQPKLASS